MATDSTSSTSAGSLISSLQQSSSSQVKKSNDQTSKSEFLNLLVTQLKNQDPMDPMKDDQFAVNLAQFSQLEQLVSINGKMGATSDMSSLTGYLGREVTMNNSNVHVNNGDGGMVNFNLGSNAATARLDILDSNKKVVATQELGALTAGKYSVPLSSTSLPNGDYTAQLTATNAAGTAITTAVNAAGIVTGVIPGDTPKLIVNGQEILTSDIKEVDIVATKTTGTTTAASAGA